MNTQTRIIILAVVVAALVAAGLYAGHTAKASATLHAAQFTELASCE